MLVQFFSHSKASHFIINVTSTGGMNMGVFEGCLVAEELAYGCTGIMTAMEASGLGVSG